MDLGISGRRALVCASSRGLGRGCATALAAEGAHVTLTGRDAESLAQTAADMRKAYPNVEVTQAAGDITTPEGREAALAACPQPDILVNNAGGPTPGDFRDWSREDWIKALDALMLSPIELDQAHRRRDDRAQIRPDRQHHLLLGEVADPFSRPVERRAQRADRLHRWPLPADRAP